MSGHIGMGFFGASDPRTVGNACQSSWKKDIDALTALKSDSTVGITTSGAFNAIYGPQLFNLAYNRHNTLACLGAKPYFTGVRFQEELSNDNNFTGNGGVIRGGYKRAPVIAKYSTVEEMYKVNEWNFAMESGMIAIENIDDVLKWQQQMDMEGKTWLNQLNKQVLTRLEDAPTVGIGQNPVGDSSAITSTERVGLESIERIISNHNEAKCVPATYAIPWYLTNNLPSSAGNALAVSRAQGNSVTDSNFDSYVDSNYTTDTTTGQATNRQLNLTMIDNMFNTCMPYWDENSTSGKVLITGYDTLTKLQAILQPQQRYEGTSFAKMSVNGISTVEGREAGFQVAKYNGVPILPDKLVGKGFYNSTEGISRIYLLDTELIGRGILKAPVVNVSDNPLIVGSYNRVCNMYDLSEIQCKGFRGQGKILHLR